MRKRARLLLALDYCIYCHNRGSCRFYYLCTPDDFAYFDDAESGSRKHFSRL